MPRTAVVIEDSRTLSRLIAEQLDQAGAHALIAETIKGAVTAFAGQSPHAVFLDLVLPDMDGVTGLPIVRKAWPSAPVVAMTAGQGEDCADSALAKAREAGADHLLRKPFTAKAFHETFEACAAAVDAGGRERRALVVDDSRTIRSFCAKALQGAGWRVFAADAWESALSRMDILGVEVVVTDIFMPGMGGIEGMERVRASWPDVAVVAMSSGLEDHSARSDALSAALRVGATSALEKPFTPEALVAAVDAATGEVEYI